MSRCRIAGHMPAEVNGKPCSTVRRGDYEVAAAAVLMRSTPFTYCFLEQLIQKGIGVRPSLQLRNVRV